MLSDVRYTLRVLLKSPLFTTVAVAALALGIGANTAIFSIVNTVLLRPLPFPQPHRLVMVWESSPGEQRANRTNVVNPTNYLAWRDRNHVFEQIAALVDYPINLSGYGDPEQIPAMAVTKEFFRVLGINPEYGRAFTAEEDAPNAPDALILSHSLWQRKFGGDPSVVGRTIHRNTRLSTIVGIMPPGFGFPNSKAEAWIPLGLSKAVSRGRYLQTVARLRPGVTPESAQAEMDALAAQLREERPDFNAKWGACVNGLQDYATGDIRRPLWVLLGAVGFVLLIACANLANLMLIRATGRRREIAVRASLGASRGRIARQLMTESLVIAVLAGVVGLLFAAWAKDALIALTPESMSIHGAVVPALDRRVLLFASVASILTGLLFGCAPAAGATRVDLNKSLKSGSRAGAGGSPGNRLRSVLVVCEVALSMVLLVGAALMICSLARLSGVSPGFDPQHTLSLGLSFGAGRTPPQQAAFLNEVLDRARGLPQVRAAGSVHFLPLSGARAATGFRVGGRPVPKPGDEPVTDVSVISPGYFAAMSIPLVRGRVFDTRDRPDSLAVVIVNQRLARDFFPGEDPIGKGLFIQWGHPSTPYTIVGVVGDVRHQALDKTPSATVFISNDQEPMGFANLVIRSAAAPEQLIGPVREIVRKLDPNVPIAGARSLDHYVSRALAAPRFESALMASFAMLALLLATLGMFGVMSYTVVQRTQEIGVRLALGANQGDVLRLVLRQGLRLALFGIVAGIMGALALTRFLTSVLFEVRPNDPATYAAISLLLGAVAIAAIWLPARRAARVDPMVALRYE
jgi:putative ABC transport system permease protein